MARISISIPDSLAQRMKAQAAAEHRSISNYIAKVLADRLALPPEAQPAAPQRPKDNEFV